jgi:hypothetical protein
MQHRAKLIALIVSLDRISKEQMEKGVKGK